MQQVLVVVNDTAGWRDLERAIAERIDGSTRFHVVVPMTKAEVETDAWRSPESVWGLPVGVRGPGPSQIENARQCGEARLADILRHIRRLGGVAEGAVGDVDPYRAVTDVLEHESFDEVLISVRPAGLSRWLGVDLPRRIARRVNVPVVTIQTATEGADAE